MSQVVETTEKTTPSAPTLADLREAAGLNQRQAAARIGRSQPRIVQIENDGVKDIDMLDVLAGAYGVSRDVVEAANNRVRGR